MFLCVLFLYIPFLVRLVQLFIGQDDDNGGCDKGQDVGSRHGVKDAVESEPKREQQGKANAEHNPIPSVSKNVFSCSLMSLTSFSKLTFFYPVRHQTHNNKKMRKPMLLGLTHLATQLFYYSILISHFQRAVCTNFLLFSQ